MTKKPTYQELEQRVKALENTVNRLNQSEGDLKEKINALYNIIAKAADGICICHNIPDEPYVRFTHWNPRMTAITGYSLEEINRLGWYQSLYPDPKIQQKAIDRMIEMREGYDIIAEAWEITTKEGRKKTLSISTSVLKKEDKKIHVLAIMQDITERKRTEESLKESEERFKFLAQNMGDIVWTLDKDFNATYVSPSIEKVLGFTPEERKKQKLEKMVTPDSMEKISTKYLEELQKDSLEDVDMDRHITIEVEYYHRNGSTIWMESNVKAIRDETGKIIGMYGVSRDITDRKRAEEKIVQAKEEWETTFNTMPDLVAILDKNFHIVRANKAMAERLGLSQGELIGKTCYEFMHGTAGPPPDCPHNKLIADAQRHDTDFFDNRLGSHFLVTASPLSDSRGELIGSIHIARDITELKCAEKKIKESENCFRTIFDQAAVGVALTSTKDGALIRANKKYCDIVGYPESDLKKMTFKHYTHPDDLQKDLNYMELIKEKKINAFSLEKRYLKPGELSVWVNLTVSSMGEDDGSPAQHIAVIEDITEKKTLAQILGIQRDMAIKLGLVRDLRKALTICIDSILNIEMIDCGGIYLVNNLDGSIDLAIHRNLPADFVRMTSHFDSNTPHVRLIQKGKTACGPYAGILKRMGLAPDEIAPRLESGLRYLLVIPILHEGRPVGVLNLGTRTNEMIPDYFRVSLEAIAAQIAGVISKISIDQSLDDSRKNLKLLFERMDDFVFILDTLGNIVHFNPAVGRRLGYSAKELSRMNVLDVHPIERRQEAAKIVSMMLEGKATACPIPIQCKDGTLIPVETKATLGKWDNKDAIFGISRDISDRLRIEKEKKISEERLIAAIEAIDEGFVIYDADDRLVMSNAKYLEFYKDSKDIMVPGESFENILKFGLERGQYPEARGREKEWLSERMSAHRSTRFSSIEQQLSDNRWLKISERKTKEGSSVGFRVDITDIKQTEEKLQKALKEKEALLKEIHHRVKNNMQVISSLLSLQTTKHNDPKLIEAFRETEARVNSMSFVHEILYQSKNFSSINLRDYLEKLARNLSDSFITGESPAVIETDGVEDMSVELKNIVPCGLIVTELVTNAFKYAIPPEAGLIIQISATRQLNGNIQLIISDNGQKLTHQIDPMKTHTLGVHLVAEIITDQLEGRFSIEQKKGVRWVIEWPA